MKVTVKQANQTIVSTIGIPNQSVVSTVGVQGPPGVATVLGAADVDASELEDGAVLVYKADTQKLTATRKLENQILEAGQY